MQAKPPQLILLRPSSDKMGVTCEWDDGFSIILPYKTLREECPCAPCRAKKQKEQKEGIEILGVQTVGNYAVEFRWSDGHATGIYPYDYLRDLGEKIKNESVLQPFHRQ